MQDNSYPDGIKWKKTFENTFSDVPVVKFMYEDKNNDLTYSDPRNKKRSDFFFLILKSASGQKFENQIFSLWSETGLYRTEGDSRSY